MSRARATGRVAHLSTLHPPRDNRIFNKECASLAREGVDLSFVEGPVEYGRVGAAAR